MKRIIGYLLILSLLSTTATACHHEDSALSSSYEYPTALILAGDRNSDGEYDVFDSNNNGILELERDAIMSLDSGIDTPNVHLSNFELQDESGKLYNLDTLKEKDITVICVWAYWCPDCFWELYGLTHMVDDNNNVYSFFENMPSNVQWISLTVQGPSNRDDWISSVNVFSNYLHLPFEHIIDDSEQTQEFISTFRNLKTDERDYTSTIPCVAIVNSDGYVLEVLYEQDGKTTAEEIIKFANTYQ